MGLRVCVFCGSRLGNPAESAALSSTIAQLGAVMAQSGHRLIYGGAKVGLMGLLADAVLANDGLVTGIIPDFLKHKEVVHEGLTELLTVSSMHERKLAMFERSEAYLVLPGGFGTLDELFEVLTLAQIDQFRNSGERINLTQKILLYNTRNFYTPLLNQTVTMEQWGFIDPAHRSYIEVATTEDILLNRVRSWSPPSGK